MQLDLFLEVCPNVVIAIFASIAVIVGILTFSKVRIVQEQNKPKIKEVKENDNRGNQKRSSKTNVHKSR